MTWQEFLSALEYYFVLYGAPGFVIAMFVLYVYLKEKYKRL
jgi:hypothetical protein